MRPHKVFQAAAWLAHNSVLYREQGITLDQNWANNFGESMINTDNCQTEPEKNINKQNTVQTETNMCNNDDQWSEDEAEIPAGVIDTILTPTDFPDDSEREQIHNVAPGEGNRPLSIFRDTYSEELAYPGIFLGQKRSEDKQRLVSAYYSEICKSELRRSD